MSKYTIFFSDVNKIPNSITIEIGQINNEYDVTLFGTGATEWAPDIQQGLLSLLENFAFSSPPQQPLLGQTWYDSSLDRLKIYNNSNDSPPSSTWMLQDVVHIGTQEPYPPGKLWYDTTEEMLKIYTGDDYLNSPENQGTYVSCLGEYLELSGGTISGNVSMKSITGKAPNLNVQLLDTNTLKLTNSTINTLNHGVFLSNVTTVSSSGNNSIVFGPLYQMYCSTDSKSINLKGTITNVMFDDGIVYPCALTVEYEGIKRVGVRQNQLVLSGYLDINNSSTKNVKILSSPSASTAINRAYFDSETANIEGTYPILLLDGTNEMSNTLYTDNLLVNHNAGLSEIRLNDYYDTFYIKNDVSTFKLTNTSTTMYSFDGTSHKIGTSSLSKKSISHVLTTPTGSGFDGVTRKYATSQSSSSGDLNSEYNAAIAWGKISFGSTGGASDYIVVNSHGCSIDVSGNEINITLDDEVAASNERYVIILSPMNDPFKAYLAKLIGLTVDFLWEYSGDTIYDTIHKGLWLYELFAEKNNTGFTIKTKVTSNRNLDYYKDGAYNGGDYMRRSRVLWNGAISQKFRHDFVTPPPFSIYNFVVYKGNTTSEDTWSSIQQS